VLDGLNNDFEHKQYLSKAISSLPAKETTILIKGHETKMFTIPGLAPRAALYLHQLWAVFFVVQRLINNDGLHCALVADDMGLGKVCERVQSTSFFFFTNYNGCRLLPCSLSLDTLSGVSRKCMRIGICLFSEAKQQ
jgi:hypothetical protein